MVYDWLYDKESGNAWCVDLLPPNAPSGEVTLCIKMLRYYRVGDKTQMGKFKQSIPLTHTHIYKVYFKNIHQVYRMSPEYAH